MGLRDRKLMRVADGQYPPNFQAIDAKFRVRGKPVIFAYGDVIFNPMCTSVPAPLVVHEQVHGDRQSWLGGPAKWWERYIDDPQFRFREEVVAHIAEFETLLRIYGDGKLNRQKYVRQTAIRLMNPIYQFVGIGGLKRAKALVAREELIEDVDAMALRASDAPTQSTGVRA